MTKDVACEDSATRAGLIEYWSIVGVAFIVLALSYSARAALGLAMPVLESDLGWSRSFTSTTGAVALIVMAIAAPIAGHLADLFSARNVLSVGLLALALGSGLSAATNSEAVFFVAFGVIAGTGFGVVAWNVVSVMVARAVTSRLGTATGIANAGSSAGQFLVVPILGVVLAAASWRWSFAGLSLASLFLVPVVWLMLSTEAKPNPSKAGHGIEFLGSLAELLRSPVFHLLFWSFLLCGYTTTGVIETHFIPYAAFCGFVPVPSATAYGIFSAINTLGMIGVGWLTDRMNRSLLLAAIYLIRGATFVILMNVGASFETLLIFAALYGVVDYSTVPVTVSLAASHLSLRALGLAMGLIAAGHNVGGALGAFAGGYLYDLTADYTWVWLSSVAMAAMAGLMTLLISEGDQNGTAFRQTKPT